MDEEEFLEYLWELREAIDDLRDVIEAGESPDRFLTEHSLDVDLLRDWQRSKQKLFHFLKER